MGLTLCLQGGCGNQLFIWALGRELEARGNRVQYDTALFDGDPGRRYMLDQLGLKLNLTYKKGSGLVIQEGSMRFKQRILEIKGDATLIGYWQCEKYFAEVADTIRSEILHNPWNESISLRSHEIAESIRPLSGEANSCFVHIRRSDNLRKAGMEVHGLLTEPGCLYYERAMDAMREQVPGVHFFVFSDDPEWCKAAFCGDSGWYDTTVVSHNAPSFTVDERHDIHYRAGGREVEDLWLMSLCHHAIIANSSFSWWGAWLNPAENEVPYKRIVMAPERWFNSTALDSQDIIPDRWQKVPIR